MNNILCQRLEIIHVNDVEKIVDNRIFPISGKQPRLINLEDSAVYSRDKANSGQGPILNETVTASTKEVGDFPFSELSLQYFILRLYTDKESFVVGSLEYPAILTYTNDKLFVNLSLKTSSPAK